MESLSTPRYHIFDETNSAIPYLLDPAASSGQHRYNYLQASSGFDRLCVNNYFENTNVEERAVKRHIVLVFPCTHGSCAACLEARPRSRLCAYFMCLALVRRNHLEGDSV